MVDFFNRLDVPSLDPLGDTALPLRTASARQSAGLSQAAVPVVFNGDGTQTQDDLRALLTGSPMDAYRWGKSKGESVAGSVLDATGIPSAINHALLGAAGIALLAIGAYMLVKD